MSYYQKLFWILTSITTFIRLFIIGRIGITVDEAHYWVYSKFLDLSYYDHPPMIGYIVKIFTDIFGVNEFAVRFPSVIIFIFTSWLFFLSAKKLFNEKTAFVGAVLLNILPVFSFLGAVVTIPDSPLSLFWMLSFYLFINIIETSNKNYWYLLGLATGFAFLSKYTAVMIFPSVFLFLLCSKQHRLWFSKKELYISVIIAFICFIPVILWNIENNWASFGFQLQHGFGKAVPKFSFTLFGRSVGAQAGYVSPLLFVFYCYALFLCLKDALFNKNKDALFIASFSFPVLFLFNSVATFNEILPHWPAMGYLTLTIYVAHLIIKFWEKKFFRMYIYAACGLAILMNLLVPVHAMFKIVPIEKFLPAAESTKEEYGIPKAEIVDITNDLYGWKELSDKINDTLKSYPADKQPFIFTHKSYLASQIFFYIPDKRVYCLSDKIDAYDLWQRDISNLANKDALFITSNFFDFKNPEQVYPFDNFEKPVEIPVYRNNRIVKKFWITVCKNFNPAKLKPEYTAELLGNKKTFREGFVIADHALFKFINNSLKNKPFDFIVSKISYIDSKGINPGLVLMIILSLVILRAEDKNKFWLMLALFTCVLVSASLINYAVKDIADRARPLAVFGEGNINVFFEFLHGKSFPSGHTEFAFTAMTFMLLIVPKYWYIYILLAFGTALERIYAGCHFPSDTAAGALIGFITAYVMVKLFKKIYKI
ncbi:MAG: glycosyltransferase family 39 protein [Endomicrobiaceae bacterium]|nr:glycosyltransferase family 39 protein [Endomicrobiaceae bacterium]